MRTFVGFGFGPIQAGVFLAEAHWSGQFSRLVVAEIQPDVLNAVRRAGGFTVNIAHADNVEALTVHPVEILNPQVDTDRVVLVEAVACADELATALPSVDSYSRGDGASIAAVLAEGLRHKAANAGPLAVIYAGENHPAAATLLEEAVMVAVPAADRPAVRRRVQFLDTVIGKMSGIPEGLGNVAPIAPGLARAFLVETYNQVSVSRVWRSGPEAGDFDPSWIAYRLGIAAFQERAAIRPYVDAKLYGHNAGHALAAYAARLLGFTRMHQLRGRPDVLAFVRDAITEESGVPLVRRYAGTDALFTREGFRAHAEDLVARMTNPFLRDSVARVRRDPARKLAWDDRLVGAMRLAMEADISPCRYAFGAAAALDALGISPRRAGSFLRELWRPATPDPGTTGRLLDAIAVACARVRAWQARRCPELAATWGRADNESGVPACSQSDGAARDVAG
jgi:mannitol-1-phosphate 5-dehydrogenase